MGSYQSQGAAPAGKNPIDRCPHVFRENEKEPGKQAQPHLRREENGPDQIGEITKIYGNFIHDDTRERDVNGGKKEIAVSKIFNNADFGYNKITVERPLRLNFEATPERIARLDETNAFRKIAESKKKNEAARLREIEEGKKRQDLIRELLGQLSQHTGNKRFMDRSVFLGELHAVGEASGVRLSAAEVRAVLEALGERDETAEICRDVKGNPEADGELRDTENVPLTENIDDYFKREVLPHVPDAWIDRKKTKVGYEVPLNRLFYRYEPPRELEEIEADILVLEKEIVGLLAEVTGSGDLK